MSKRIPSLDGLRAVSIGFVLLGHLDGTRYYPQALYHLTHFANFGVRVFFVISGYLITRNILGDLDRARFSFGQFYVRRMRRIFPALIFTVILTSWPEPCGVRR